MTENSLEQERLAGLLQAQGLQSTEASVQTSEEAPQ
jgi:hypothetical protein